MLKIAQAMKYKFAWGFILVAVVTIAVGEVEQKAVKTDGSEEVSLMSTDKVEDSNIADNNSASDSQNVPTIQSITFRKDVGIRDALRFLAAKYRKNIVPSVKVDGNITVTSLYDVTFEEAMEAILGYDFKYEQDGNFIKVYTSEEYKKLKEDTGRMTYEVFTLYYISAAEAKKLVQPVLSTNGKIETTTAAQTGVPTSESISADTGGGDTIAMHDTLVIFDYPEKIVNAKKVIALIDIKPKQVLVEATILSATLTEDTQFGIDWQTLKGTAITALAGVTQDSPGYLKSAGSSQVTKSGGLIVGFSIDDIGAFIKAVEEITDVTILANPKILAVNKQLGQVYIGTKLAYKSQTTQNQNSTTEQVAFLDTGTKLSFRPYIGDDGYIRMDIHPKDSSGALNAENLPDETSAELVTNIMVKDGQTIVIGGLFRDKITNKKTQIPVIGNIPYIGTAFKGTADKVERQEVIVLLTPHIIHEPEQTEGQARSDDVQRKKTASKDNLQWISRSRLAMDSYAEAIKYYQIGDRKKALEKVDAALQLDPLYLEAIRLKEMIIRETNPEKAKKLERVALTEMEKKEASKWRRN